MHLNVRLFDSMKCRVEPRKTRRFWFLTTTLLLAGISSVAGQVIGDDAWRVSLLQELEIQCLLGGVSPAGTHR